jgi:diamine N-acetyltransferase
MLITAKNKKNVFLRKLNLNDIDSLYEYLQNLSDETKNRFGPHRFDKESIINFHQHANSHFGYVAFSAETAEMIAYSVIKIGYLEHDSFRLQSYGITLHSKTDCTFAPSVADAWQSCGIGDKLLQFILSDLKRQEVKRIILWGGVQLSNARAINFYKKNGFKVSGQFNYKGDNYDMMLEI